MTKRISVTVSDDLYEKMQKWKDNFNFSLVFREAVATAIGKKEDYQQRLKEDPNMEQIIERLRVEKAGLEENYYEKGKIEGLRWAKATSYEEIMAVLDWDSTQGVPEYESWAEDSLVGDMQADPHMDWDVGDPDSANYFATQYMEGWDRAVKEFWKYIKDKL